MPEVTFFMCALQTLKDDQNVLVVRGPLNTLKPPYIPGAFSFSVVFGMRGFKLNAKHVIRLVFKDPDGKEIRQLGPFPLQVPGDVEPDKSDEYREFIADIHLQNITFEQEGIHTAEIYLDDKKIDEFSIPVTPGKRGE